MSKEIEIDRGDGRKQGAQLRQIKTEQSPINQADGSASVSQGRTCVLAAVYGPIEVQSREEQLDRATIQVSCKAPNGLETDAEREIASLLQRCFNGVVLTALHPRTSIDIQIQVLRDHGSLLAVALNAVTMALLDAGVPMNFLVAGVTCCCLPDSGMVYDPTLVEEEEAQSTFTFAFGSSPLQVVMIQADGEFSEESLYEGQGGCQQAAATVLGFLKNAIKTNKKYSFLK